ncbi:MAG: hypothetical protein ABIP39_10770, partial [Polyangiaceae bacterium]
EWGFGAGAPLWEGDLPQARAKDKGAVVEVANRTQNTFEIDVNATEPARILVNTTYDLGWRTDVGVAVEENKQLAIDVPAGRRRIHVRYWPRTLSYGIILTMLGIGGILAYFARRLQRPQSPGRLGRAQPSIQRTGHAALVATETPAEAAKHEFE